MVDDVVLLMDEMWRVQGVDAATPGLVFEKAAFETKALNEWNLYPSTLSTSHGSF